MRDRLRAILSALRDRGELGVYEYAARELISPAWVRELFTVIAMRRPDVTFDGRTLRLAGKGEETGK